MTGTDEERSEFAIHVDNLCDYIRSVDPRAASDEYLWFSVAKLACRRRNREAAGFQAWEAMAFCEEYGIKWRWWWR